MMKDDHIFLVRAKLLKQMKNSRELHSLICSAAAATAGVTHCSWKQKPLAQVCC